MSASLLRALEMRAIVAVPSPGTCRTALAGDPLRRVDDAEWAGDLGCLHEVRLFTSEEAERIIAAADAHGSFQLRGDYEGTTTVDMDVRSVPSLADWLERCASEQWLPLIMEHFSVDCHLAHLRLVKYAAEASRGRGIGMHSDGSELSFVCALNDGFEGGGTYVRRASRRILPAPGVALLFCGRWIHAGIPVCSGTRYVLTGFFSAATANSPQLQDTLKTLQDHEDQGSVMPRRCPKGWWLRRAFCEEWRGTSEHRCTQCGVEVACNRALHSCGNACCGCGTAWCDACLKSAMQDDECTASSDPCPCNGMLALQVDCQLLGVKVPDGSCLPHDSTQRIGWRLSLSGLPKDMRSRLRLVREDFDSDERIGTRELGSEALVWQPDGTLQAAIDLRTPNVAGPFRVYFRLLLSGPDQAATFVGDRLWADFVVLADAEGTMANQSNARGATRTSGLLAMADSVLDDGDAAVALEMYECVLGGSSSTDPDEDEQGFSAAVGATCCLVQLAERSLAANGDSVEGLQDLPVKMAAALARLQPALVHVSAGEQETAEGQALAELAARAQDLMSLLRATACGANCITGTPPRR